MTWFILLVTILQARSSDTWYSYEGGNNPIHHDWGKAGDAIIRHYPTLPFSAMDWPVSARVISNVVGASKQGLTPSSPRNISTFLTMWGQFILHDMIYTAKGDVDWPIEVPCGDPWFDPDCLGNQTIVFKRTQGGRDKFNSNTCWLDGSQIYGSTYEVNRALRSFKDGLLRVSNEVDSRFGEFPPFLYEIPFELRINVDTENDAEVFPTDDLFALGDPRANIDPLLLSIHILFWREHNRVARILLHRNPHWDDNKLYQAARRYVIAEMQHITYEEYLFWLLGRPFPKQDHYDPEVDPRPHIFFSTVAFRYGHSEVSDLLWNITQGHYGQFPMWHAARLEDHYFDPIFLTDVKLSDVFEGLAGSIQKAVDNEMSDSIRNFLFKSPHKPSVDLFATDIQRGRDHLIPSFNHVRVAYGLQPYDTWEAFDSLDSQFGQDAHEIKLKLSTVYRTPWEADPFVAGVAENWVISRFSEKHHDYSNLADLFEAAIISQFQRTRVGDRFWYIRNLDIINQRGLEPVQHRSLAKIIRDNIDGVDIPDEVFKVRTP